MKPKIIENSYRNKSSYKWPKVQMINVSNDWLIYQKRNQEKLFGKVKINQTINQIKNQTTNWKQWFKKINSFNKIKNNQN